MPGSYLNGYLFGEAVATFRAPSFCGESPPTHPTRGHRNFDFGVATFFNTLKNQSPQTRYSFHGAGNCHTTALRGRGYTPKVGSRFPVVYGLFGRELGELLNFPQKPVDSLLMLVSFSCNISGESMLRDNSIPVATI